MRVLWISCLLLGIVTTLPTKRGKVSPRSRGPPLYREGGSSYDGSPLVYNQPSAPETRRKTSSSGLQYRPTGYNPSVAGYEGALPVAASSMPYAGILGYPAGYPGYPMVHGAGYARPVAAYRVPNEGDPPVPNDYYDNIIWDMYSAFPNTQRRRDGPAAAFPAYNEVPYAAAPQPHVPDMGFVSPVSPYPVSPVSPYFENPYPVSPVSPYSVNPYPVSPGSPYPVSPVSPYSDGYEAPVATTHPDGQEASVAPDYSGQYWGSVGGEANEPVFSDVSDLEPVSSFNSRSRYLRGRTVFYEATYIPEEGPAVPAETGYAPEEGPVPETRPTPWMGYPTGSMLQKRPVMNPVKQRYPPSNAVKRRY